jgi:hypothetical protein
MHFRNRSSLQRVLQNLDREATFHAQIKKEQVSCPHTLSNLMILTAVTQWHMLLHYENMLGRRISSSTALIPHFLGSVGDRTKF